jgi:acyl carrier protein
MSDLSTPTASPALADVFRRALDLPADVDLATLAYSQHENWDSVGHMVLVAEIEEAFGVLLDTDDVLGLSDYQAAVEVLGRHGVEL